MKKLLLTLSLLPVLSFSQIINFSDPNFKTMLLSASASNTIAENLQNANFKIDVNNDGEIQQSEALQVKRLKLIGGNIVSIPELIEFANLTELQVENNTILAFNLSDHPALQEIDWRNNQTTNFSVNNIQTLTRLGLTAHQLTAISVVGCPLVEYSVNSDGITSLDLAGLNSLSYFSYEGNSLGALYNIAGLPSLQYVSIYEEAPMVALDLSNTTSLTFLSVRSESLQSLNLSGCSSLSYIDMSSAVNVSNLNLTGCIALDDLYLSMNQGLEELELDGLLALNNLTITLSEITSLHISNCPLLESVDAILGNLSQYAIENCPSLTSLMFDGNHLSGSYSLSEFPLLNYYNVGGNQISAIDFSGCTELESIDVTGNQLTQLDVSDCHSLVNLFAEGNPLETILAKNGSVESYLGFSYYGGNNGEEILLKFICADEAQIESIQASINSSLPENDIVVSSYCSFTPGGNFNTITGIARVDADTNGCSASDVTVPNVKVKINDGTDQGYTFVETDGTYSFYTATGNFAISAEYENPTYFVASAPITVNFPAENGSIFNQDICVVPNGVHPDLEIIIAPTNQAQPGFDATYEILYRNKGNQTLSGDFTLNFEDDVLDFLQASSAPISQTANSLAWNFSTLQPFASGSVWVNFNVNGPMETPPVNIDDVLDFTATINPIAGDDLPLDNTFTLHQTVVGSFDPNDKHCLEGNTVSPTKIGDYLHYVINFENTGTFPATNIVIADEIDQSKFDISTFQLTSAPTIADVRITGNKVEFILPNINLGVNERGNVTFKIKTKNTLTVGATVTNIANIFFDYNFPIETNPANTTFQQLSVSEFDRDNSIVVSPNPVSDVLHVKANSEIKSIQVYDIHGRLVMTQLPSMMETVIEMKQNNSGIYFVRVVSGEGMSVQKVMKQ